MVAVDTNVVVRLLTRDDEAQYQRSLALFQAEEILILDTVILETEWVLRFAYDFAPDEICAALRKLFGLPNVHLQDENLMARVLQWHEAGLDFADALHLSRSLDVLCTFDTQFAKRAEGLTDCEVRWL